MILIKNKIYMYVCMYVCMCKNNIFLRLAVETEEESRTSETEEQRKERRGTRREKDRARRRLKGKKRSPDTDEYEKQRLATLKRLKRGEVDLRLEKVVTSKQLRLAVETEEERITRLEAFLKSWQLCLSFKLDVLTT